MIQLFPWPHQILNEVCSVWTKEDSINGYDDIEQFENDMIKLMLENKGMGLAANQIGITKRFFAIGSETFDKFKKSAIIWNPRLITQSEEKVIDEEGCLSFKGIFIKVERSKVIEVEYETTQGTKETQDLITWNPSVSSMNTITLKVLHLIKEYSKLRWDMAKKKLEKIKQEN